MMVLSDSERIVTTCLAILTQYITACDRDRDRITQAGT